MDIRENRAECEQLIYEFVEDIQELALDWYRRKHGVEECLDGFLRLSDGQYDEDYRENAGYDEDFFAETLHSVIHCSVPGGIDTVFKNRDARSKAREV